MPVPPTGLSSDSSRRPFVASQIVARPLAASGRQAPAVGAERDVLERTGSASDVEQPPPGLRAPDCDRRACRRQPRPVRAERNRRGLHRDRGDGAGRLDGAMQCVDSLRQRMRAAARRLHRTQPEQDAELGIDVDVRSGGRSQLPRGRDLRLVLGVVALLEREDGQARSDQRRNARARRRARGADGSSAARAPSRAPAEPPRPAAPPPWPRRSRPGTRARDRSARSRTRRPRTRKRSSWTPRISRLGSRSTSRHSRAADESRLVGAKVVPSGGDPVLEPGPPAEQRLVGDLDRRRFGARVAVEREQPRGTVGIDRQRQPALVDIEGVQLGPLHARRRVSAASPRVTRRRNSCRTACCPGSSSPSVERLGLGRRPRPRCRRSPRTARLVSVEPSRRSWSSVSASARSGRAAGSSTTSATIRPSKPSSSAAPTRFAGPAIACSSSSRESGSTGSTRSRITPPKPRWRRGRS